MNQLVDLFIYPLTPILSILAATIVLVLLECLPKYPLHRLKFFVACVGTIASIVFTLLLWRSGTYSSISPELIEMASWLFEFQQAYLFDAISLAFFLGIGLFTLISLVFIGFHFKDYHDRGEIFLLVLFVTLGIQFLVTANNLLILFLALELLSLPTYVLVGIQRNNPRGAEAALKYFLFGSFASVLFVLGIAFFYANFGTLHMPTLGQRVRDYIGYANSPATVPIFTYAGLALVTIASAFKVGLVPFHMWVPDTYQGAPSSVTGFMGSAIKLAGFALILRLFGTTFLALSDHWATILNCLAIITMFVGNLAALKQDNLKRLFAYSSIAHAGYLILAITAASASLGPNFDAIFYYLIVYGLMFLGVFGVITVLEQRTQAAEIYHLSGLGFTHPVLSLCLVLFVLSAAGIPPTAGFMAKYFVFLEAVHAGNTFLVVLAVITSLIGAYYYLRIIVYLYMKESREAAALPTRHPLVFTCIVLCALSMLYFAVAPAHLYGVGG